MTPTMVALADLESEALGRITDYTDPTGVNIRTNRLQDANRATTAITLKAHQEFNHAIEFSDDYDEILTAALAAVDANRYTTAADMISTELREHVNRMRVLRPQYGPEQTKAAFEFLQEQLLELMSDVRKNEKPLKGIHTASQALRGGGEAQDAWATLEDHVDRYIALRRIQRRILVILGNTSAAGPRRISILNRSGLLAASFDLSTYYTGARRFWRTARPDSKAQDFDEWLTAPPRPPYDLNGNEVLPDDAIGYLRWISADDKAWIPDEEELFRVDELAERMLDSAQSAKKRQEAKDAYYDGRSITPAAAAKRSIE